MPGRGMPRGGGGYMVRLNTSLDVFQFRCYLIMRHESLQDGVVRSAVKHHIFVMCLARDMVVGIQCTQGVKIEEKRSTSPVFIGTILDITTYVSRNQKETLTFRYCTPFISKTDTGNCMSNRLLCFWVFSLIIIWYVFRKLKQYLRNMEGCLLFIALQSKRFWCT